MAAYMIVQIKITREQGWPEYRERVSKLFAEHGVRYLVRGGQVAVLEGSHDGRRLVVFEFPSMEAIREAWNSPEYAEVKKLREGSGELDVWAVPGVSIWVNRPPPAGIATRAPTRPVQRRSGGGSEPRRLSRAFSEAHSTIKLLRGVRLG